MTGTESNNMSKSLKINVILNIIKTLCQVIFPIITIPYISRTLGTENYGKVNYSASIISYFSLFATFGINNYAMREGPRIRDNKKKFLHFSNQLFAITITTSLASITILFIIIKVFRFDKDCQTLLLIQGTAIIFTALGTDWINTIFEDYTYIALRYICIQIISLMLLVLLVKTNKDFLIYVIILTLASSGANLLNIIYIRKYIYLKPRFTSETIRHFRSMLILVGYSFTLTIYVNSDITLLGILKGDIDVGIYSIATKIYLVIKQVLNAGIIVTVPRIASLLGKKNRNAYEALLHSVIDFLTVIIFPAMIGVFMLSKNIVILVSGKEYLNAYLPLKILSISLCFAVLGCFLSNCILLPNKKDKEMLAATLSGCIINLILNFIVIPLFSYVGTATTTLLAEIVVFFICFLKSRYIVIVRINLKNLISVIMGCCFIIATCVFAQIYVTGLVLNTIISIGISGLGYGLILIIFRNSVIMDFIKKFQKISNR